jgi:2,3-dihydroxy-p-cumate/2,3-dihydroxybenzoate 3,4-dioxygenase
MARYRKLGYVALTVTNLEKSKDHYNRTLGLELSGGGERDEVFLRCSADHHNVILYGGARPGLKRIGWEMESAAELAAMKEELIAAGVKVVDVSAAECKALHQGPSFRMTEPHSGATFEYYSSMRQYGNPFQPTVAKIQRLGHVVIRATDLEKATEFYQNTLGFRLSDAVDGMISFFRCFPNPFHHGIGVARSDRRGLHHVNFMTSEIDDIGKAIWRFKREGVDVVFGPGRHPPSGSMFLYFLDPDGITNEYSFGMEEFPETGARNPRVLEPIAESLDFWGAVRDPRLSTVGEIEPLEA